MLPPQVGVRVGVRVGVLFRVPASDTVMVTDMSTFGGGDPP